jgi:poly(beta-D-mannuronate) C5 epimerase
VPPLGMRLGDVMARRVIVGSGRGRVTAALLAAVALLVAVTGPMAGAASAPATTATTPTSVTTDNPGLYHGSDPDRDLKAYFPFQVVDYPRALDPAMRGVRLTTTGLELVQGGQLLRTVPFPAGQPVSFETVVRALPTRDWISEPAPGLFLLRSAFVQAPGTTVTFAAPGVRELRLATDPGVFVGGTGAAARFDHVKVTSWDLRRQAPSEDVAAARPFVLYERASRLDISDSELAYLGSDRIASYGVAWRLEGTTGTVTNSVFHHCFFGAYTYGARDVVFRGNVFRDNAYYGLDPHDYSTGIVAEENEAYGNGSHGFIFSRFVTNGAVRGNRSHDNAGNGIVMDFHSDRNVIAGNVVERNKGDGIVLLGSSENVVENNDVRSNRIGVRANKPGGRNVIRSNRIRGNEVGLHAYGEASDLFIDKNEVRDSRAAAIILEGPRMTVRGGVVAGGPKGLEIRADSAVADLTVEAVDEGVVVRSQGVADLRQLSVHARRTGVRVEPGGRSALADSTIQADRPTRGLVRLGNGNSLDARSLRGASSWLAVAGLVAVSLAIALEALVFLRERRERRPRLWRAA